MYVTQQAYSTPAMMVSLKFVIVFLVQLHAQGLCDRRDDVDNAIILFYKQLNSSNSLVETTASNMWKSEISNVSQTITNELASNIEQFKLLYDKVTVFAENYPGGKDCTKELDVFLNASNYRLNVIDIENLVFQNLFTSATEDIQIGVNKFYEIGDEYNLNCLETNSSCEGLSDGIVAEIDRVLPLVKRIPYKLFAEIYLLNFRIALNWQTAQVILMEDYHKVIENATICLTSVIKDYKQINVVESPNTQENLGDSILELYENLTLATESASSSSISALVTYVSDVMEQTSRDYVHTIKKVRNVTFTANSTIASIKNIARDLNITVNCSTSDIQSVIDSILARHFNNYRGLLNELIDSQYKEGVKKISIITKELSSIEPQVKTCVAEGTCDYLAGKIVSKTSEVPLWMQKVRDSTSALFLRTVPTVWETGAKAGRALLEQLEIEIVNLKSCIQRNL